MYYTKLTDFASKDALLSGNPSKLVRGTELGAEFDAIAIAIATKYDSATLGASSGSSLSGFIQSGTGAVATTVQTKLRESVSVKDFGAVGDGVTDDTAAIQDALDAVTTAGGGVVYAPPGTYLIAGDGLINIKASVTLRGAGAATRFVSGTGGKNGNHAFVYLKDDAAIEDCRISGSDYIRQSGGANYICYNKIGVTTQGATLGKGFRVSRVGFEKLTNSHVFVFNAHYDVLIDGCYTFGQQVGGYANVDANYLVSSWNATADIPSQVAGTQVYCLTNFYNSGNATTDVVITGGRHFNICDAFVGINGNSSRHTISDNVFVKNATGYYGGWGIDLNTGDECVVTGNYISGGSTGAHLYGAVDNTITGNIFACDRGVWLYDPTTIKNTIAGNTIKLVSNVATVTAKLGISVQGASNNNITGNTIDCQSIASAKGIYFETAGSGSIGNAVLSNLIANAATGVESADASNDSNFAQGNIFRTVTTTYPRQLSTGLQNLKGLSGTSSNCNNMGGTVTISDANTNAAVAFANTEPDTSYRVMLSVRSTAGTPAAGAFTPIAPSALTTGGFTVNISAAPGVGNSVSYNWFLFRA